MNNKFDDECVEKQKSVAFKTTLESKKRAEQLKNNSSYFLKAAQNIIKTDTPNVAVMLGFFAMENKANQLIALKGYDIKAHECTLIYLAKVLNNRKLADKMNKAYQLRLEYNYKLDLKAKDISEVKKFISDAEEFIKEVDGII